jgi:hypothetical protein
MNDDVAALLAKGIEFLSVPRTRLYWKEPIPNDLDQEISTFLEKVHNLPVSGRELIVDVIKQEHTGALVAYAERMATLAVRRGEEDPIRLGLWAVVLAWREAWDQRDVIRRMGVLFDAARRIGADAVKLVEQAGRRAPGDISEVFFSFARRPDLESIGVAMGYSEGRDSDGFRYRG